MDNFSIAFQNIYSITDFWLVDSKKNENIWSWITWISNSIEFEKFITFEKKTHVKLENVIDKMVRKNPQSFEIYVHKKNGQTMPKFKLSF